MAITMKIAILKKKKENQLEKESLLLSSYKDEMEDEIVDEWKRYMGDF